MALSKVGDQENGSFTTHIGGTSSRTQTGPSEHTVCSQQ